MAILGKDKRIWILATVLTAFIAVGSGNAQAQGAVSEELRLLKEETVVTAARHEQPISQAPSNVYVITDEDIRHSGATDIPTVLRRIPGIEVMQLSGAQFDVSVRGDNQPLANKLLVLIDGRSVYEDIEGVVFWKAFSITLPEIKRIEVLKGPASAVYGFNAFDGVINIITKTPEEMSGTTLQLGGGEFGTLTASAIQAGTIDKLGYRLSVGRDQNNQWRNRHALAFRDHKFNVHTEYQFSGDSKLEVSGGLADVNRYDGPIAEANAESIRFTDGYASARYQAGKFLLHGYWRQYNPDGATSFADGLGQFLKITDLTGNPNFSFVANTYDLLAQYGLDFGINHNVILGGEYRRNNLSGNLISAESSEDRLGFFLQDEWRALPKVRVVAGVRLDLHTEIHATISPRLAFLYSPVLDHTFRLSGSVAYRPPTLFETAFRENVITTLPFLPFPIVTVGQGSRNLEPEQIISYEADYQGWYFKHRLRLRAAAFFNHISDLINFRATSSGTTAVNDPGHSDIYGGEIGGEGILASWLTGFANFSYQEVGQSFTDTVRRGVPRFKFNLGLRGEWDNGLSADMVLHHVGAATYPISNAFFTFAPFGVVPPDTRLGSYNLLNLRAGYRFWHEKAEVAVSIFNAMNDRHKEHPLGDTIGSRVMGWLTIRL
jgi:iron complex outermembrane receptor protein